VRSIVFRFEDPQALALALDGAAAGLVMPTGQTGSVGEWVLALFEVGSRRRSTASAARVVSYGEARELRLLLEARDVERLHEFATVRGEAVRVALPTPESRRVEPEAAFEVTLSGRFKAATIPRVLVTDVQASTEVLVREALSSLPAVVDSTTTIAASIETLRATSPALWVVGIELSDGNGLDAVRQARHELHHAVPVLVVAQAPASRLAVQAFSAGATDFIAHPFRASELAARTVTLLSHSGVRTP